MVITPKAPIDSLGKALLALQSAEQQVLTLRQKLQDRKLIDRAKGILQARFGWTEEQAYLHLRRTSRRNRTAMRTIAAEIIESSQYFAEERRAS